MFGSGAYSLFRGEPACGRSTDCRWTTVGVSPPMAPRSGTIRRTNSHFMWTNFLENILCSRFSFCRTASGWLISRAPRVRMNGRSGTITQGRDTRTCASPRILDNPPDTPASIAVRRAP